MNEQPVNNFNSMPTVSLMTWNRNGLRHKTHRLALLVTQHSPTIIAITETRLSSDIASKELLQGYTIYRRDRESGRGGGVLLAVKDDHPVVVTRTTSSKTGELVHVDLLMPSKQKISVACYYRPPDETGFEAVSTWLRTEALHGVILTGDFNMSGIDWLHNGVPHNVPKRGQKISFLDFVNQCGLKQIVNVPTHDGGNTLDLVLHNLDQEVSLVTTESGLSDHVALLT